jgi:hypothetical protein
MMGVILLILFSSSSPIGVVGVIGSTWGVRGGDINLEIIDSLAQTEIGWIRIWFNWYQIEHDSGTYDWSTTDSIVNAYATRGFNIFVTLQGGNLFYDTLSSYPDSLYPHPEYGTPPIYREEALDAWLNFVSNAVNRYRSIVKYWSIWNEPNLRDYWPPQPDTLGYLELVKVTSSLIKSIDPEAKIISGNTSLIDFKFLGAIIDSLIPYTDYIGFHPYRSYPEDDQDNFPVANLIVEPTPMTSFDEEMDSLLNMLRNADTTGRVKLWDEESGFPSHPDPVLWENNHICDTVQVKNLLRKYLLDFAYFVEVSTYWGDYDLNSIWYNALGENWVDNFYDMTIEDWEEKEYQFLFKLHSPYLYSPEGYRLD